MELRQLEYFVAVVDEGGFTRAAARLHVAQPGVSAQIRQLERELGEELLDRSGRQVRLTPVGEAVLPYARAALAAVGGAQQVVGELTGLLRGRVTLGIVAAEPSLDLPGLLAGFHRDHPSVEISSVQERTADLEQGVREGRLDLAVISLASTTPPGLEIQVVLDQEIIAAVTEDHELAAATEVPLTALKDLPLTAQVKGTGMRAVLDEACAAAGYRPYVAFEAAEPFMQAALATRGLGVAILPEPLSRTLPNLRILTITGARLRGRMALAWRADQAMSPAARALLQRARAALPDLPQAT